jgi:hypothetical protein
MTPTPLPSARRSRLVKSVRKQYVDDATPDPGGANIHPAWESSMGVVAWIVLGLLAGIVAKQLTGRREPNLPLITAVIAKIPRASQAPDGTRR